MRTACGIFESKVTKGILGRLSAQVVFSIFHTRGNINLLFYIKSRQKYKLWKPIGDYNKMIRRNNLRKSLWSHFSRPLVHCTTF